MFIYIRFKGALISGGLCSAEFWSEVKIFKLKELIQYGGPKLTICSKQNVPSSSFISIIMKKGVFEIADYESDLQNILI